MRKIFYAILGLFAYFLTAVPASAHTIPAVDTPVAAQGSLVPFFLMLWTVYVAAIFLYFVYKSQQANKSERANSYRRFGNGLIAVFAVLALFLYATHLGCTCFGDNQFGLEKHTQHECCLTPVVILTSTAEIRPEVGLFAAVPFIPAYKSHLFSFSINNKSPPA
ncbi:MAG: hypothetical protein ABI643_01870 [Candidatus Doudnabacteria bacterium]